MVGVAVKLTEVPEQTLFEEAVIDTLTGFSGLTVMEMLFEVAGLPVAQVALEVSVQVMTSPFEGV